MKKLNLPALIRSQPIILALTPLFDWAGLQHPDVKAGKSR